MEYAHASSLVSSSKQHGTSVSGAPTFVLGIRCDPGMEYQRQERSLETGLSLFLQRAACNSLRSSLKRPLTQMNPETSLQRRSFRPSQHEAELKCKFIKKKKKLNIGFKAQELG